MDVTNLGHWKTEIAVPENPFGFLYLIINKISNRKYIGKKQVQCKRKKALRKGKKKREIVIKETDWKTYTSSCNDLNDDIVKFGKENFEFHIIRFCDSKWELGYWEIAEQIKQEVMFKKEYYNGIVNCRLCKLKEYR